MAAWLNQTGSAPKSLDTVCTIGRGETNDIILSDELASRRHAVINRQGRDEYWVVDLGSTNGVRLNGKRLTKPTQLRPGDIFRVGGSDFEFEEESFEESMRGMGEDGATVINPLMMGTSAARSEECWILVADLVGFTEISRTKTTEDVARIVSRWIGQCSAIFRSHRTEIQAYLGDGFLAYMPNRDQTRFFKIVAQMRELQLDSPLPFRIVLHHGSVAVGGMAPNGDESILGEEVNRLFRLEKVAGQNDVMCAMTEAAVNKWAGPAQPELVGRFVLKGFDETEPLYRMP